MVRDPLAALTEWLRQLRDEDVDFLEGGSKVEEALKGQDGLVVAGGNAALLFQLAEHALDAVAILVRR